MDMFGSYKNQCHAFMKHLNVTFLSVNTHSFNTGWHRIYWPSKPLLQLGNLNRIHLPFFHWLSIVTMVIFSIYVFCKNCIIIVLIFRIFFIIFLKCLFKTDTFDRNGGRTSGWTRDSRRGSSTCVLTTASRTSTSGHSLWTRTWGVLSTWTRCTPLTPSRWALDLCDILKI